ncbi:hypothetical protein [Nocardia macrotermitis]|uniref:Glycosyltransferase RgtA/B/C/D-like domain-containing protein n=1 Tax=Nocardia macrotermitis TaxID=2585198 RepID=A0A7K0CWX6_9NOCA|nr:hypothetical protein [Nocardia macrotermitis]MQY17452.1 hypothetical protein [Nocardia macrotermitis]
MIEVVPVRPQASVEVPGDVRRGWPGWTAVAAVLSGVLLLAWRAAQYGQWVVDDAGITFAYARSVAAGLGPVLQPGAQPVEGFSDPTWLMVLVVGKWCHLFDSGSLFGIPDFVLYPKAIGLLCCAGILVACHVAARRVTRWPALVTFAVGVVLAMIPSFVIWCFSGLENSLFAVAVCVLAVRMFVAVSEGRLWTPAVAVTVGVLAAFAALTRPDGLVYLAAYPVVSLVLVRRATWLTALRHVLYSVVAFAIPFGAYLVWRIVEFGRLVANTAVAKHQALPSLDELTRVMDLVHYAGTPAVVAGVAVVVVALVWAGERRERLVALLVPLVLAMLAYCVLRPDWMAQFRFATPVWALAAFVVVIAAAEVLAVVGARWRVVAALALVAALIPSGVAWAGDTERYRANSDVPLCWIALRFGRYFNGYADILHLDKGTLLAPDMGGSSLTSRLRLVDMAGLTDARIADIRAGKAGINLGDYVFEDLRPTFVHSHGVWMGSGLTVDPRMSRDYYRIQQSENTSSPDEDWVRKDVVPSARQLQQLREYSSNVLPHLLPDYQKTGECGTVLRPGQTVTGR